MFLTSRLRRVADSSAREKEMIARTLFWLGFFRIRNLILPYRLTRKWVSGEISDLRVAELYNEAIVNEVTASILRCRQYIPGANCLIQALATRAVLAHYGQRSNIRLGVVKSEVSIDAHAWVEVDGRVIIGRNPNAQRYSVLRPPSLS